ncbi:UNVERIFIED_CONTAM: hypothetical protein Slati_4197300 [Sesamum latifolium]|uniref:Reverse transcriptase n=1 Tax=Sesamum latifolium TaxID=2727402 RepID=A0AAW2TB54_9LAMI
MEDSEMRGGIRGIAVAQNTPRVSHFLFADDTLIYCQASIEVMRLIRTFCNVMGKRPDNG